MWSKLEEVEARYLELEQVLSDPQIVNDREKYIKISKEYSDLEEIVIL